MIQVACKITFPYFLVLCFACTGCFPYKIATCDLPISCITHPEDEENRQKAQEHWLYRCIPRHRCQLYWYDVGHWVAWALFGNDDDGIFGEEVRYKVERISDTGKALCWGVRNPLHNFCFYVIGSAERCNSELTFIQLAPGNSKCFHYEPVGQTNFPSKSSCFYAGLHGWKPYIALRLAYPQGYGTDFYLGWRCRGNFGIKFIPLKNIQ